MWENDVACERRVGVSKLEVRAISSHWKQQPCDLPALSFDKINSRWIAIP